MQVTKKRPGEEPLSGSPPERFGRHARFAMEDTAEVSAVCKPDQAGDLGDGNWLRFEQFPGAVNPIALEIFDGRGTHFLAEAEGQVILGDVDITRNLPAGDRLGKILVDIHHRLADEPLRFAAQPAPRAGPRAARA